MASGRMALGDAKSGRDVDPTLRPDLRLAFRRPGRQTDGPHMTQGIIFAYVMHNFPRKMFTINSNKVLTIFKEVCQLLRADENALKL